ncbi:cytochrome PufQ [Marivita sp. GX14005]|uniref:cytochrome PufQ n=1 Tax=Marivita sp. GX14005 TaxID=2942276 RepID=UPI002018B39C|nr:cytochrome PufQ [Marivita sp. GX14005]MCL3883083.1 cytochrome PufQ [Marivita sp. GX14005]
MSDVTSNATGLGPVRHKPHHRREYSVYFALVFLTALPFAAAGWGAHVIRHRRRPGRSPLRAALSDAAIITPRIFSA